MIAFGLSDKRGELKRPVVVGVQIRVRVKGEGEG